MRGKGEGTVFKDKRGLWTVAIELPPINGERRRKVIRRKSKKDALASLEQLKADLAARGDLPSRDQTVDQWFAYWLDFKRTTVRPNTLRGYRDASAHIVSAIGSVKLSKVTAAHVRRVHASMEAASLSSTTQLLAHRTMAVSFKQALREGRIARNPAELTDAPRKRAIDLEALTLDEALRLLERLTQDPDGARWITHLLTGARRGEVLGIELDRVTDSIDLSWQLQRIPRNAVVPADFERRHVIGGLWLTRPKSRSGWRVIPLVDPLKSVLERHIVAQGPNSHGLLFTRPDGHPHDPDQASKEWRDVLASVGIERDVVLHGLRHTAVDLLLLAGVPEDVVMEIVGHSNRAVTRGYKSRNSPRVRAAMQAVSDLLTQAAEMRRELES